MEEERLMGESEPIRVLLVDDHAAVRSGLGAFLLAIDDLELVGEAGSGEAYARRPTLASEAAQALIQAMRQPPKLGFDLTEHELEVLALLIEGLTNPEIANRLMVSRSTVKFHVSSVLSRLGVTNRTEAVSLAMQRKLV
jgi:NarL family two-component system response regulator LiaR